jgi:glycosyltransferase involved in cell wall biosynthesis
VLGARRVIVVMPAYNAALTLRRTVSEIDRNVVDEVLMVDDASGDSTTDEARRLDVVVEVHEANRGYGGCQKTCFVVGSRILAQDAVSAGMPLYKYFANRALTFVENLLLGTKLSEFHTGLRAYSRELLESIPYERNSEDFVFDNQVVVQALAAGVRIGEISCPTRYEPESSSIGLWDSTKYGIGVMRTATQYRRHEKGTAVYPYLQVSTPRPEGTITRARADDG